MHLFDRRGQVLVADGSGADSSCLQPPDEGVKEALIGAHSMRDEWQEQERLTETVKIPWI